MEKPSQSSITGEFITPEGRIKLSVSIVKANRRSLNSTKSTWKRAGLFKALYHVSGGQEDEKDTIPAVIQTMTQEPKYTEPLPTWNFGAYNEERTY